METIKFIEHDNRYYISKDDYMKLLEEYKTLKEIYDKEQIRKQKSAEKSREYYKKNKDVIYEKHKDYIIEYQKKFQQTEEGKKRSVEYSRKYRERKKQKDALK